MFGRPQKNLGRPKNLFGRPKKVFGRPKNGRPKNIFGRPIFLDVQKLLWPPQSSPFSNTLVFMKGPQSNNRE